MQSLRNRNRFDTVKKVVVITGIFDGVQKERLAYINRASELGDIVVVGVYSDEWLSRKSIQPFMPFEDRIALVQKVSKVNYVIPFNDSDDTSIDAINWAKRVFPDNEVVYLGNPENL